MQINIKLIYGKERNMEKIFHWSKSVEKISCVEMSENIPGDISIIIQSGDKFYMDGMSDITSIVDRLKIDSNDEYYVDNDVRIPIYSKNGNYIPGYYILKYVSKDEEYFSCLKINPKLVTSDEYSKMIYDLENIAEGLSQRMTRGFHGVVQNNQKRKLINRKIDILSFNFKKFQSTIYSIDRNPRQEIYSKYRWNNKVSSGLDYKSSIMMSSHPRNNMYYGKHHEINYSIMDNVILKNNLLYIYDVCRFIKRVTNDYETLVKKYESIIDSIFHSFWMEDVVDKKGFVSNTSSSFMNNDYYFINKLASSLKKAADVNIDKYRNFSYIHKSSHELYEIWGFFKTIDAFYNCGFIETEGSDLYNMSNSDVISNICNGVPDGLSIKMKKEFTLDGVIREIYATVIYNESISNNYTKGYLYTSSRHNKPDVRIDFFDEEATYIGSSVIDMKYRRKNNFMEYEYKHGAYDQLKDYSDSIKSRVRYSSDKYDESAIFMNKANSSVECIGVMYPGKFMNGDKTHGYETLGTNFELESIVSYPGCTEQNIEKFISKSFKKITYRTKVAMKK